MANTYDIGDEVQLTDSFTQNAAALDPTTVSVIVQAPDRTLTTYVYGTDVEVVRTAQGNYYVNVTPTMAGIYRYRWTSTGTGKTSEESWFEVRPQLVPDED